MTACALPTAVLAESKALDIYLHKVILPDNKEGNSVEINNQGQELPNSNYEGLDGVEFSLYEITSDFEALTATGLEDTEAQKKLIDKTYDFTTMSPLQTAMTSTVEGQQGLGAFHLLDDGTTHAYLIVESKTPNNIKVKANPIVIVTPLYNEKGLMSALHIYPKNILLNSEAPGETDTTPPSTPTHPNTSMAGKKLPSAGDLKTNLGIFGSLFITLGLIFYIRKKLMLKPQLDKEHKQ
ncbi:pilin N-terminal domain-containing protein [Lactococcus petauri]|uniref:pilin N-terminal domain-containing protein n=1 Tax=Lactococcus petauri TaxID=1940789 RepID=UPI00254EEFE8|nr:pilin N-terminal domain-containing protein [Lactococcus petauri]